MMNAPTSSYGILERRREQPSVIDITALIKSSKKRSSGFAFESSNDENNGKQGNTSTLRDVLKTLTLEQKQGT